MRRRCNAEKSVLFEKITAVVVQIEDKPLPLVDRI